VPVSVGTWVLFIASEGRDVPNRIARWPKGRLNRYNIRDIVHVVGEPPAGLRQGGHMVRIESNSPIKVADESRFAKGQILTFRGVT